MHQTNLLRLFSFVALLVCYCWMFDPSTTVFINASQKILNMDLNYQNIITVVSWLIGMWGLLLFLNTNKNTLRLTILSLFILTSLINFCFFKILKTSFSSANISQFDSVLARLSEIPGTELLKFIVGSAIFIVISKYIKPLAIGFNRIFLVILAGVIVTNFTIFTNSPIALPSLYVVSSVILWKYFLLLLNLIKAKLGIPSATAK